MNLVITISYYKTEVKKYKYCLNEVFSATNDVNETLLFREDLKTENSEKENKLCVTRKYTCSC